MALRGQDVIVAYRAILRRIPQQQEERFWTSEAASRRTFADLCGTLIVQATEVRSIARLYLGLLGRFPDGLTFLPRDNDGLTYWTGLLRAFRAEHRAVPYRMALSYCIDEWFLSEEHKMLYAPDLPVAGFADAFAERLTGLRWADIDPPAEVSEPTTKAGYAVAIAESGICKSHFNEMIDSALRTTAGEAKRDQDAIVLPNA